MAQRLFGMETEYAFTALGRGGSALDRGTTLRRFMGLVKGRFPCLPDRNTGGMFLGNGSLLYIDCGLHPELSTPECANPWDAARYVLAGERILTELAAEMVRTHREVFEVTLLKCNVDYSGTRSTWGCHESYLHRADPSSMPKQILPHLISRIVYTGAGGFDSRSPRLEFTLSPRVPHLAKSVSRESTRERGIYHTKQEPLCAGGYHRLHILCSESLCSQTGTWLKVGATALVAAMIEAGLVPGDAVELSCPLSAMQAFAGDPSCTATVKGRDGQPLTAVAIQRHYLRLAEAHVGESFMPSWASDVVGLWRQVLDRLERGAPDSVATTLDWAIKLNLYRHRVEQRGVGWDEIATSCDLAKELFEIDARFGQLGGKGIFDALDGAGVLAHRVAGVERIEDAVSEPPEVGRARLRGQCVKRFSGRGDLHQADWQSVYDFEGSRFLDLSDPYQTQERWQDLPGGCGPSGRLRERELLSLFASGRRPRCTPEGFSVGDRVVLGAPEGAAESESRSPLEGSPAHMSRYAGRVATIVRIVRVAPPGHSLVQVDVDGGAWAWRTRNLRRAPQGSRAAP